MSYISYSLGVRVILEAESSVEEVRALLSLPLGLRGNSDEDRFHLSLHPLILEGSEACPLGWRGKGVVWDTVLPLTSPPL